MCDSSTHGDSVATAESRFVTKFYMIFIHLHPRDEAKKLNINGIVVCNGHITTNRLLVRLHPKIIRDGSWKNKSRRILEWFNIDFQTKVGITNLTFWTWKSWLLFITLQEKGHREFFFFATLRFEIFCLGILWVWCRKKVCTLKCLCAHQDAVWSWYIYRGYLGRCTKARLIYRRSVDPTFSRDW